MPREAEPVVDRDRVADQAPAASHGEGPDRVVGFSSRSLGSLLRLSVRPGLRALEEAAADRVAAHAWDVVCSEFDAVDRTLSRFRADSELTFLNRLAGSGTIVPVSRRLRMALAIIDRASRITGNRFDASILGALERLGEEGARLDVASDAASEPASDVAIAVPAEERTWRAHVPPVPVDMGGIGKGLALRWASAEALPRLAPDGGLLLEAGGDIVAAGTPPDEGWRIGIEDPVAVPDAGAPPLVVMELFGGAVATSSVRVRHWIGPDGRPVHHLIDPRTREPARTGLIAVTVAWADPAWAEVWSKSLFLAGRDGIANEARARGLAAWWVDDRGRLGMTPEARVRTLWAAEDRLG